MRTINVTDLIEQLIVAALAGTPRQPLVIGLCGAQGSGKSTIARALVARLNAAGINAATLSLDDLYLRRAERAVLAREVHPLLQTRGVPGTHEVALGLALFAALDRGKAVRLLRFDKALDDRAGEAAWVTVPATLDVLLFEGWCVGARPQPAAALAVPINQLEREEDADGRWRAFVNSTLAGDYQRLFARLDQLFLLAAPDFATVYAWRREQELQLRHSVTGPGVMNDAEVRRFVQHYERLTRSILDEMPRRADLTIQLAADRSVIGHSGSQTLR